MNRAGSLPDEAGAVKGGTLIIARGHAVMGPVV
ncbi:hypothetical protein QO009_000058 [Brevibacillus aydinogluensis]|nr:hypothetical protein [Brevibacillus aydinogluensis]